MNLKNDMNIELVIKPIMEEICASEEKKAIWRPSSKYAWMKRLSLDSRGDVGERTVTTILENNGYEVLWSKETRNKEYDVFAKNKMTGQTLYIEVKTATMGNSAMTFQHESIEKDRGYNSIIFMDFAPDDLYVTCLCKTELPFDNTSSNPYLPHCGPMHRRKYGVHYKWTLALNHVMNNVVTSDVEFMNLFRLMETRIK